MDHNVIVSDYSAMDRVLKEERAYILNIVKQIKKSGCNVLLVQKSILRDAISDLAIHFLDKIKVMVIKDIEREDIPYVCKTLGCRPIASLDHFLPENLVTAELVEEVQTGSSKFVKVYNRFDLAVTFTKFAWSWINYLTFLGTDNRNSESRPYSHRAGTR